MACNETGSGVAIEPEPHLVTFVAALIIEDAVDLAGRDLRPRSR